MQLLERVRRPVDRRVQPVRHQELPPTKVSYTIPPAIGLQMENMHIHVEDELLTLVVRDAPLKDVLTLVAETQHLNIVCAYDIDTAVTLSLDKVTLEDAITAMLSVSGYTWSLANGIIHITSMAANNSLPAAAQARQLKVIPLDYVSAVVVGQTVQGLLSPVGQSFLSESNPEDNRRTQEVIVVEDLPYYVDRISRYIAETDQPPRQVMIQVHVLQVDLQRDQRSGVNFKRLFDILGNELTISTAGFATPAAPQAFFAGLTGQQVDSLVELLTTTLDAKTLASPRVLALNGQESRFQVGEQLGFRVTTTTETSTLESVEFLDVGIVLKVTPRITRDHRVLMRIMPEVSSGNVNPETGLPEEKTTELQTDVLLGDGEGMVIGGLIQETDSNSQSKIPILGNLKKIGLLFQKRELSRNRKEIIVTLIPHILPYDYDYAQRDALETDRARTPLTYGPLHRVPRPFEPRLPDACYNPVPPGEAIDNHCPGGTTKECRSKRHKRKRAWLRR